MLWTHPKIVQNKGKFITINFITSNSLGQHFQIYGQYGRRVRKNKRLYLIIYIQVLRYSFYRISTKHGLVAKVWKFLKEKFNDAFRNQLIYLQLIAKSIDK